MAKTWVAGEEITAAGLNLMQSPSNVTVTYDSLGRVATYVDVEEGKTYSMAYNTDGTLDTVTEGANVWTYAYTSDGKVSSVTKT